MGNEMNALNKLHSAFTASAIRFRERVCEECNYSVPTFYRKVRSGDKIENGRLVSVLSNAEKGKIREIADEVIGELESSVSNWVYNK